jgi:tudor domain-containing protein 2
LVATLIPDDSCWYRTKVVSIEPDDESEEDESILSVNLVDFGDTIVVKQSFVASLRPDFLSIQFQAIQCSMAYIEPKG